MDKSIFTRALPSWKQDRLIKGEGEGGGQQCLPLDWSLQILHNTSQPCNTTATTTTGLQFISLRLSNPVLSTIYICFYKWQAGSKLYQEHHQQQHQDHNWWYEEVQVDNAIQQRPICHSDPLSEGWGRSRLSKQVRANWLRGLKLKQIYVLPTWLKSNYVKH